MQQNQDPFFVCPKCPNKVFSNARAVEIHKLKHENPESHKKNTNEKVSTQPKFVQLTTYPDMSTKKHDKSLELIDLLGRKRNRNKQLISPAIQTEVIQRLIMKEIITVYWNCKFCELSKFTNEHAAELHVCGAHYNLKANDIIKHVQITKIKKSVSKTINKWICKVCNAVAFRENKTVRCLSKHRALFNNTNPQLKSKMLTSYLICPKYTCMLCKKEIGTSSKAVQTHISQKHINIFSEYFCHFEDPQPSVNTDIVTNDIVVKNLLERVGITIFSKTTGLQKHGVKRLPHELYSCALCPHTIIFQREEIPYHMWSKHTLRENYGKLVATIPTEMIMNCSDTTKTVIYCPCQYTSFSRDILSMPVINIVYNGMPNNSTDDNIDPEIKLMRIYKSQFVHHNLYKLIINPKYREKIKRVPKLTGSNDKQENIGYPQYPKLRRNPKYVYIKRTDVNVIETNISDEISGVQPNNNEITDNDNFIISNATFEDVEKTEDPIEISDDETTDLIKLSDEEDTIDLFKLSDEEDTSQGQNDEELRIEISFGELNDINKTSNNHLLVMKEFLMKGGITDERSIMQSRVVHKVPEEVYSCLLCPHLTIFSSDDLKFHMNTEHKLTEDYSKLISVVAVESIIESRSENADDVLIILSCLCKFTSFTKGALSMPIIDRTCKEIIKNLGELKTMNSETKLLRIFQHQFTHHYKQKLIVVTNDKEKKRKLE